MYFFVDTQTRTLVGSGGFKGAPLDGMVEIGYEIAPDWRGRGCATAAARALVERARASGLVTRVAAETLPAANTSGSVLRKLGFVRVGEASDPDVGVTWRWGADLVIAPTALEIRNKRPDGGDSHRVVRFVGLGS